MTDPTTLAADIEYRHDTGWVDRPRVLAPALEGNVTCDVAVIGGGLAGMAAALRLAERGVDVALLEGDVCGWGASSRNAGYVTNTVGADIDLLRLFHRTRLPSLMRFAEAAVEWTEDLLENRAIDCDYRRSGIVGAAVTPAQLRRARRMVDVLGPAGWNAEYVEGDGLGLPRGFLGGIREPMGGLMNSGKYSLALRDLVIASAARVFENTIVSAVEDEGARVAVNSTTGRVRADRVLLATNAYSRNLDIAPRHLASPLWVSLVETEPVSEEQLAAAGWTSRAGLVTQHALMENYRVTPHGTVIAGTRQVQTARGRVQGCTPDPAIVADLIRALHQRFSGLRNVTPRRTWGGWIACTPSWLPAAGDATPRVSYAIGCNGHGLAQAPYLGTLLADRLCGDRTADDLRAVWRERPRFLPGMLASRPVVKAAWLADRAADRLQRKP